MKELKGTKTEKNLMDAFAGESQARNKYTYYASKARKDGYEQIAALFEETAGNEKEHAKLWFKYLNGGEVPSTVENLKDAAAGENFEWTDMYDRMAKEADEEASRRLPPSSVWLAPSSVTTRSAIASCFRTSRGALSSLVTATASGSAATVAISLLARRLRRFAPFATTR